MTDEDLENLKFLLMIDDAVLQDWFSKMDSGDHLYAIELLRTYAKTLQGAQEMLDNLGL